MSLIKEYTTYSNKPRSEDILIDKLHKDYQGVKREVQKTCPSCQSENYTFAFDKYSFHYVQCSECMSLYVHNILSKSKTLEYEACMENDYYSTVEYENYLKVITDKISFELELTFSRIFSKKETLNVAYFGNKSDVYKNGLKNFNINFNTNKSINHKKYNLIIVDHFIEKSEDLNIFMKKMNSLLIENGFLYITIRVGTGIDILTLWEDSKIYPLEHSKLLSIDGIKILLKNNQFLLKELNTPGVLDIDNILKTKSKNIPKFMTYLKKSNDSMAADELQRYVQKNLLSSFATIIVQKG